MIIAFSTSSPVASVAVLSPDGTVLASAETEARSGALGACMALLEELLEETGLSVAKASLFLADLGPGSFIGVRVAVTLAKTFAFAGGAKAGGADAFDLISPHSDVALPSKKGEYFVRRVGAEPYRTTELPADIKIGFGPDFPNPTYPRASGFGQLLSLIEIVDPVELVPRYLIEPSISTPKKPYTITGVGHA